VTGLMGTREKLSRKGRNYDRFDGNTRKAVKKRLELRQVGSEYEKSCQNTRGIKTAFKKDHGELSKSKLLNFKITDGAEK
jgi:hypothetical protein